MEEKIKRVPYTEFGKTKLVPCTIFLNGNPVSDNSTNYDETYWIERGEEWYGLGSTGLRNKRVLVVTREEFLRSPIIGDNVGNYKSNK